MKTTKHIGIWTVYQPWGFKAKDALALWSSWKLEVIPWQINNLNVEKYDKAWNYNFITKTYQHMESLGHGGPQNHSSYWPVEWENHIRFLGHLSFENHPEIGTWNRIQSCLGSKMFSFNTHHPIFSWLVVWNIIFMTFRILGMSSSQLLFIFFRGVGSTNQVFFQHPPTNF